MNHSTTPNRWPRLSMSIVIVLLAALVLATADRLVSVLSILLLIFAGMLFGVFVHAISAWPTRSLPLSYRTSFLTVVTLLLFTIGMGCFYLGSQIAQRADDLWSQIQASAQTASEQLSQSEWANRYLPNMEEIREKAEKSSGSILPEMFQGLQSIGWALTGLLVIFFVGLYAAYEPDLYRTGLLQLVPRHRRERASGVLDHLHTSLRSWIVGRCLSMSIVGVATAIAMWAFGIPMPVSLGILAALLTFIPNIGPLLAAIPQMLLAIDSGSQTVLYVVLFNLILQTVESYLITPLVQRQQVSLPPILTILAQLAMGVLVGIIGVMMAAPLVVVLMVLTQKMYVQDQLGVNAED